MVSKRLKVRFIINSYLKTFILSLFLLAVYSGYNLVTPIFALMIPFLLAYCFGSFTLLTETDLKKEGVQNLKHLSSKLLLCSLSTLAILLSYVVYQEQLIFTQTKILIPYLISNVISFVYLYSLGNSILKD